jgi:hypothetical protein
MRKAKPIPDLTPKIEEIVGVLSDSTVVASLSGLLGGGPSLYFYRKLLQSRASAGSVGNFVGNSCNLELAYALLGLWGMNTRAAHMKDFVSFTNAVTQAGPNLIKLETALAQGIDAATLQLLGEVYESLDVMETESNLISTAKLLHFLLPDYLMPVDGENTLMYLYGTKWESTIRYLEIVKFLFQVRSEVNQRQVQWHTDQDWNANFAKIVDNAIIFLKSKDKKPISPAVPQTT